MRGVVGYRPSDCRKRRVESVTKTSGQAQCYYRVSTAAVWRLTLIYRGEEMEMQPEIFILRQTTCTLPDPVPNKQHLHCETEYILQLECVASQTCREAALHLHTLRYPSKTDGCLELEVGDSSH